MNTAIKNIYNFSATKFRGDFCGSCWFIGFPCSSSSNFVKTFPNSRFGIAIFGISWQFGISWFSSPGQGCKFFCDFRKLGENYDCDCDNLQSYCEMRVICDILEICDFLFIVNCDFLLADHGIQISFVARSGKQIGQLELVALTRDNFHLGFKLRAEFELNRRVRICDRLFWDKYNVLHKCCIKEKW